LRKRKIRGHNRRHKQVKNWKENNLSLRKDILDNFQSDHIDIVVHPWCDLSLSNSIGKIPPSGSIIRPLFISNNRSLI